MHTFDLTYQDTFDAAGQSMRHHTLRIDDGSRARIGCPQHGAPQLHGPHTRNMQVLFDGDGITKPSNIAEVDHERRRVFGFRKVLCKFFAK